MLTNTICWWECVYRSTAENVQPQENDSTHPHCCRESRRLDTSVLKHPADGKHATQTDTQSCVCNLCLFIGFDK